MRVAVALATSGRPNGNFQTMALDRRRRTSLAGIASGLGKDLVFQGAVAVFHRVEHREMVMVAFDDQPGFDIHALPDHRQPHLFGIEDEIDSLRITDTNPPFADLRIAAAKHHGR